MTAPSMAHSEPPPAPEQRAVGARILVGLGWLALFVIALGAVASAVPLRNGRDQDCGAPRAFLVQDRPNVYPDANGRVKQNDGKQTQLSSLEVKRAVERPCSKRVADRMVPAGALLAGGMLTGLTCVLAAGVGAFRRPRRGWADPADAPDPPPGAAGPAPS